MKKSEILWNEFIRQHRLYECGYGSIIKRQIAFVQFRTAFLAGE